MSQTDLKTAVVLYDYVAKQDEELSIKKNEKLSVLDDRKTWWKVRNDRGAEGFVPSNYVRLEKKKSGLKEMFNKKILRSKPDPEPEPSAYQQVDLVRSTPTSNTGKTIGLVKYTYEAKQPDELAITKGDRVVIVEKEEDGWWRGEANGQIGWFPSNYVEEIVSGGGGGGGGGDAAAMAGAPTGMNSQSGQGARDGGGGGGGGDSSSSSSFVCVVRALYPFNSGNPEELPFQKGDVMDIVGQPPDDPDWWEAITPSGSKGLVPRNYVEVVHDAQPVYPPNQKSANVTAPSFSSPMTTATNDVGGGGGGGGGAAASGIHNYQDRQWFFGSIPRSACEQKLAPSGVGDYLVRESESTVRFFLRGGRGFQNT